ncbi:TPA: hypothetical protein OMD59_003741 [Klebsiella pneumoniae]|nr:hypothetical protein [Klebsiella variicola]HCQ8263010.1 hypothetical protein [Klebsiella pneumoniae]
MPAEGRQALALMCPSGVGRQKNLLLKILPLLLLGYWGKRRIWKLVFGPAPKVVLQEMQLLAELMKSVGLATKPRVIRIPQLTDAQLCELCMPILTIIGERDVLLDSRNTSYRVKFPGVAEIFYEHPPKRQQQAAAAKAPEITPFTS